MRVPHRRRAGVAALASLAVLTGLPSTASAAPEFFGPDAFFNQRVDDESRLDRDSHLYASELQRQVREDSATVAIRRYSVPIRRVGSKQPRVRVTIDAPGAQRLQALMASVPVPAHAAGAAGTDGALAIYQASTDTMWEFWRFTTEDDGFHADWGGRVEGVDSSPGYYRSLLDPATGDALEKPFFGVNATHTNLLGGVITVPELRSGRIDHALALAIPRARAGVWALPATGTDGAEASGSAIPEGARFRLDPDLDIDRLDLPPMTEMMARAAQRYGIVVVNTAQSVAFVSEDPAGRASDPYPEILDGLRPEQIADAFPWEHLQTLPLELTDGSNTGDALRGADRRRRAKPARR